MAVTLKVAVWPWFTVALAGCVVIEGAVFTVSVAELLVTELTEFVTTHLKVDPLSVDTVAGVV